MDYKDLINWAVKDNSDYKKFCEGVDKLCRQIDEETKEGEREIRFMNKTFRPSDIIEE